MKQLIFQESWLDSWKYSYPYDLLEIYASFDAPGYTYAYGNRRKHTLDLIQKVAKPGAKILVLSTIQGNFTF